MPAPSGSGRVRAWVGARAAAIALMRAAANWGQFQRSLKRAFPVLNDQYEMNLGDD